MLILPGFIELKWKFLNFDTYGKSQCCSHCGYFQQQQVHVHMHCVHFSYPCHLKHSQDVQTLHPTLPGGFHRPCSLCEQMSQMKSAVQPYQALGQEHNKASTLAVAISLAIRRAGRKHSAGARTKWNPGLFSQVACAMWGCSCPILIVFLPFWAPRLPRLILGGADALIFLSLKANLWYCSWQS